MSTFLGEDQTAPEFRAIFGCVVHFFSQSMAHVYQTLSPRPPIVASGQKAPIAVGAQQKGGAVAKPLREVKHGQADFLLRGAQLPRFTVCFSSRSTARLSFDFHSGFATQGREPE